MLRTFLIKYAEIGIKGKNRYLFENALCKQIKIALSRVDGAFEVTKEMFLLSNGHPLMVIDSIPCKFSSDKPDVLSFGNCSKFKAKTDAGSLRVVIGAPFANVIDASPLPVASNDTNSV